jgi:protein-disulfide isomerase
LTTRRNLLLGFGAAALALGAGQFWRQRSRAFEFQPVPGVDGFRQISRGQVSGAVDIFAGIGDSPADPAFQRRVQELATNPCAALFRDRSSTAAVRIASFSDYNCPYCRVLTAELRRIEENAELPIAMTWHELPLLGETSQSAARAALAADMQGEYAEFHRRLMRSRFIQTEEFLAVLARDIGLDPTQLVRDAAGNKVETRIQDALALAEIFGIPGTPALVVGRTLVIGQISPARLHALIRLEARTSGAPCG